MGTSWSLHAASSAPGLAAGVQAAFGRVTRQMSQWEPDSDLSRFNRAPAGEWQRSEEHTSELQSLMRISYAVFCLKKKNKSHKTTSVLPSLQAATRIRYHKCHHYYN